MTSKKWEAVDWFAEEHMKQRLNEHDHYGIHWSSTAPAYLIARLGEHYKTLCGLVDIVRHATSANPVDPVVDYAAIITEAADIANYAMMLADNARGEILVSLANALSAGEVEEVDDGTL